MGWPSGVVTLPETSICAAGSWPSAVPHTVKVNSRLIPTALRKWRCLVPNQRLPWSMSFMGAPSSCGSSHGLEALLGDQLAIRQEHYVSGLEGPGEFCRVIGIGKKRGGRPTPHYGCARQRGDCSVPCACPPRRDRIPARSYGSVTRIEIRVGWLPRKGPRPRASHSALLTGTGAAAILAGSERRLWEPWPIHVGATPTTPRASSTGC